MTWRFFVIAAIVLLPIGALGLANTIHHPLSVGAAAAAAYVDPDADQLEDAIDDSWARGATVGYERGYTDGACAVLRRVDPGPRTTTYCAASAPAAAGMTPQERAIWARIRP